MMMTDPRRARALMAPLALAAILIGSLPLASGAAAVKPSAAKAPRAKNAHATAKPAPYRPHTGLAPADEYFGRLKMSILGVRNKVKELGLDADAHPDRERTILGNATWVEDAMRDWAKKYPYDRWLPRYAYALEEMYERLPGSEAHRRAVRQVAYLTAYFPQTVYGRVGRAKYALGVPPVDAPEPERRDSELSRLALIDGKVLPTMPPARAPSPSPSASPSLPPAAAEPAPTATQAPTGAPAASASARP